MSGHRVDQFNQIEQLMDRVRQAYEPAPTSDPAVDRSADNFERDPTRFNPDGPAFRNQVDVARQYSDNMVAAQYVNPEAFGRSRGGQHRVVVKAETSANDYRNNQPYAPAGLQQRLGVGVARGRREGVGHATIPPWIRTEMALSQAVDLIEQRARTAFLNPQTRGAVEAMTQGRSGNARTNGELPPEQQYFDAAGDAPIPDVTNPGFAYVPGASYFESLADGAQVVSGQGADFSDPNVTKTYVFGRPQR